MKYSNTNKKEAQHFRAKKKYWLVEGEEVTVIGRESVRFDIHSHEYYIGNSPTPFKDDDLNGLYDDEDEARLVTLVQRVPWLLEKLNKKRTLIDSLKKNLFIKETRPGVFVNPHGMIWYSPSEENGKKWVCRFRIPKIMRRFDSHGNLVDFLEYDSCLLESRSLNGLVKDVMKKFDECTQETIGLLSRIRGFFFKGMEEEK